MRRLIHVLAAIVLTMGVAVGACDSTADGPGPVGPVGPQGDLGPDSGADVVAGSGTMTTETRDVSNFDQIDLQGEGHVVVVVGGDFSLEIETDDNLFAYLEATVDDGTLVMRTVDDEPVDLDPTDTVRWRITMPSIRDITLSGAGTIELEGVDGDRIDATLSGAGEISLSQLAVERLAVTLSGAGTIRSDGTAGRVELTLLGTGTIDGADLESSMAICVLEGTGDIVVWATETLDVSGTGLGTISVYGEPQMSGDTSRVIDLGVK